MKNKKVFTSKTYRLKKDSCPLNYMLASHNSSRSPLLYFDEDTGVNRPLRYARNQRSPFVDEQDGNAILEPIVFEDGLLHVTKENQVLQKFLYYHPSRNQVFEEVDNERDASEDVEVLEMELNAQIVAKELSFEKLLSVSRILLGGSVDRLSSAELKRDILLFSKHNPYEFLEVVNDPELEFEDEVRQFFDENMLSFRNKNKDVYFNLKGNKKKMLSIPFGEDPFYIVASYLKTDEGVEVYKGLVKMLGE
tara:strand:- start:5628 stop:6377 length:750 start_codon:yes stop_codon:yes gene_type:complete